MITITINISYIIWFVSSIIHPQSIRGNEEMESPLVESLLVSSAKVPVIVISHIHIYDCNFFSCTWVPLWYPNITIFIYKFGPKILIWYLFNLQLSIVCSKTLDTHTIIFVIAPYKNYFYDNEWCTMKLRLQDLSCVDNHSVYNFRVLITF